MKSGITAIAYETIRTRKGTSAAADADERSCGRMSIQEGAKYPGTAVRGPRHLARRRAGRGAGQRRR